MELKCNNCLAPLSLNGKKKRIVTCEYCGSENLLAPQIKRASVADSHKFASQLYRQINDEFSAEELEDLVMRLNEEISQNLDYEDIEVGSKRMIAMELVKWCRRRDLLQELVNVIYQVRPEMEMILP